MFGAFTELTTAFTAGKRKGREREEGCGMKSYDVPTMCQ